ncbi:MAG: hypothetical protein NVS3B16_10760 [Vulcanimicrobiaceae bacterium]
MSIGGVPHVQKEAELIVRDQRNAIFAASALALGLFAGAALPAAAADADASSTPPAVTSATAAAGASPAIPAAAPRDANESGDTLSPEAGVTVAPAAASPWHTVSPHAFAAAPARSRPHAQVWISHAAVRIAAKIKYRNDASLRLGKTAVIDAGRPGLRVVTYRNVRPSDGKATRTLLASRIVRAPRTRVIARGVAAYASLARVAEQGFASAMHFAGSAFHMIATAYTAGCAGCTGITSSGVRAGFGIIAVDPRVIPLGTKLFIPGYGRAVAGDTGGAILGNRVDLGMNRQSEALLYGRRPITVYVLR